MKTLTFIITLTSLLQLNAQKWVDTLYPYVRTTVNYGQAIDFAGNNRTLNMDLCLPLNDNPPPCGRPLLIAIHGGAFMAGSKEDADIQHWMIDYAKRGYVTAAINYRLGQFQTSSAAHCNVTQLFNVAWDCSNMADTAEWYRACYRGIQDAKGALRYLVLNYAKYSIDTRNIFLAGESAGGFIALGTAFMDTAAEKPAFCNANASVSPPNSIYENTCVKQFNWDTSIASMNLSRPDLGPFSGNLNTNAGPYNIKGIGNFFGGTFPGWFKHNINPNPPAIYMYHQPNDLIVPYKTNKVLKGFSDCFTGVGCANIINLPWLHGSAGVRNQIETIKALGQPAPAYWFDSTLNTADCVAQASNPALTGHAIDNYWLRSLHMAQYFAPLIDESTNCNLFITDKQSFESALSVYPNPFLSTVNISYTGAIQSIQLYDIAGKQIPASIQTLANGTSTLTPAQTLQSGVYFLAIKSSSGISTVRKITKVL